MYRIALIVETSLASGREIVAGVAQYLEQKNDWSITHMLAPMGRIHPQQLSNWTGDGIIARITDPPLLDLIVSQQLPTVDVLGNVPESPFPLVQNDQHAIGRSVADHFIQSALTHFGFIGLKDELWSKMREAGFESELKRPRHSFSSFYLEPNNTSNNALCYDFEALKKWISERPIPCGLMICSDQFAPIVFEACHALHKKIPEQISIVGVDNDPPFYKLCRPQLTSVEPYHAKVGYHAAKILDQQMRGIAFGKKVYTIKQHSLSVRVSSDWLAIEDSQVRKALRVIQKNACAGIQVEQIAQQAGMSRSTLQRRFRIHLKRSVHQIILDQKIKEACKLLSDRSLSISQVAEQSGLGSQEYLSYIFKKHMGQTPHRYRSKR
ncbi:MAG: XylR family transcriptional regulator [Opitutales bacterium]